VTTGGVEAVTVSDPEVITEFETDVAAKETETNVASGKPE